MSRATFEAPTIRPAWSLIGETVTETSISRPSLRTRTVSKSLTLSPRAIRCEDRRLLGLALRRDQASSTGWPIISAAG